MSRPPRTVIEYRNYELPADFPIQMLSGENWRISDVPSGVLHFHNCLEIGLCESDGGFLGFRGEQRAFRAGDVTIISGDVPHTTWSDPGTASKWSYLHLDPFELVRPLFPAEALPNGELLQQPCRGIITSFRRRNIRRCSRWSGPCWPRCSSARWTMRSACGGCSWRWALS